MRIEGDGALKESPRFIKVGHVEGRPHRANDIRCAHQEIVRLPGHRRLQQGALRLGLVYMGREDCDDRPGNFILNGEDILQVSVVALSPTVSAGNSIDELGADADSIASPTDTALENIAHTEFAADLSYIR